MRRTPWMVLALTLTGFGRAAADVAPPNRKDVKRISATIELDWGPYADRVTRRHVVAAGETLSSIAAKDLGEKSRWKAIVEANPEIANDPDHIKVGATLWLPPPRAFDPPPTASAAPSALAPWYEAFWFQFARKNIIAIARGAASEIPVERRGGGVLVLVPRPEALHVLEAVAGGRAGGEEVFGDRQLLAYLGPETRAHRDDPAVRTHCKYTLGEPDKRMIKVAVEETRYDKEGKIVKERYVVPDLWSDEKPIPLTLIPTPAADVARPDPPAMDAVPAAPPDDAGRWPPTTGLLVAGAGLAVVLGAWALRRRRPTPPAA